MPKSATTADFTVHAARAASTAAVAPPALALASPVLDNMRFLSVSPLEQPDGHVPQTSLTIKVRAYL